MSSGRKNDAFSEAVVGLFMVAILALLAYFTIIISGVDVLKGRERTRAEISFDSVGGLREQDSVMYRGTKVGAVEEILVEPDELRVIVEIDRSVVLREGYRIEVCSLSMLGGNYLVLEEGEGKIVDIASAKLRGETPSDWMRDVANIARNLKELTGRAELESIITNIDAVSSAVRGIAERLERGEGTLGRLLSSDTQLYDELHETLDNVKEITGRVERGEGTVGRLLSSDDTLYAGLEEAVAAFKSACASFDMGDEVRGGVTNLTSSALALLGNLNEVAERLKNGEGTLGRLTKDSALLDEVEGLVKDIRQVVDNYRDTTPISTFGSLIMGGL